MSKIFCSILCVVCLFCCSEAGAQSTLQFSSVKYITLSGVGTSSSGGIVATSAITVNPGTVWKIESASVSALYTPSNSYFTSNLVGLSLDHTVILLGGSANRLSSFPIWLPAGNYTFRIFDAYSSTFNSNYTLRGMISAIEFNIVAP